MTPFECARLYMALKLHFFSGYDFFKYKGKVRLDKDAFDAKKERVKYAQLASTKSNNEIRDLFISNFAAGREEWIGYFCEDEATKIYSVWLSYKESMTYHFTNEIKKIAEFMKEVDMPFNKLFEPENGQHPPLLRYFYAKEISFETLIICAVIFKFIPMWEKKILDDLIWPNTLFAIRKYRPFVEFDKDKMKNIAKSAFIG